MAAVLLRDSGAYHHVTPMMERPNSYRSSRRLLEISEEDRAEICNAGDKWRFSNGARWARLTADRPIPEQLIDSWAHLILNWNQPVFDPTSRDGSPAKWWRHAFRVFAISDRAARGSGFSIDAQQDGHMFDYERVKKGGFWPAFAFTSFRNKLGDQLEAVFESFGVEYEVPNYELLRMSQNNLHTLTAAHRDQVSVLPKSKTSQIGCTLRSISHNLCLLPARGLVRGTWLVQETGNASKNALVRHPFNLVVVPFPYAINPGQFKVVGSLQGDQKSADYTFIGDADANISEWTRGLIREAENSVGEVHGLVFPELSLTAHQFDKVFEFVKGHTNIELLCAGLNQKWPVGGSGRVSPTNLAVMSTFEKVSEEIAKNPKPWTREHAICSHQKHHRWKLDAAQIKGYGLASSLDPSYIWWEDLQVLSRKLAFVVARNRWTVTTLICEDLARVDPAQQIVRAVGPNLVFSLLMDGPQLTNRWSSRYATVLAEDPGSAVLTVNSIGLIRRSENVRKIEGNKESNERSIALWRDGVGDTVEIKIGKADHAACITLYEYDENEYTMDGRRNHHNSIGLRLGNYIPLRLSDSNFPLPEVS